MEGIQIKNLRLQKGISLTAFSEKTGISKSYLSLIERDIQTNPSIEIVEKIANGLDVEVEYLIAHDPKDSKKPIVRSIIKFEIELTPDQLHPQKLMKLKELINELNDM